MPPKYKVIMFVSLSQCGLRQVSRGLEQGWHEGRQVLQVQDQILCLVKILTFCSQNGFCINFEILEILHSNSINLNCWDFGVPSNFLPNLNASLAPSLLHLVSTFCVLKFLSPPEKCHNIFTIDSELTSSHYILENLPKRSGEWWQGQSSTWRGLNSVWLNGVRTHFSADNTSVQSSWIEEVLLHNLVNGSKTSVSHSTNVNTQCWNFLKLFLFSYH